MPRSIKLFSVILLGALAIDLANNFAHWSVLASGMASRGTAPTVLLLLVACLASPVLGLLFSYLIARRGSNIARWLLAGIVAIGTVGTVLSLTHASVFAAQTMLWIAGFTELLKVIAAVLPFRADARAYFASEGVTA